MSGLDELRPVFPVNGMPLSTSRQVTADRLDASRHKRVTTRERDHGYPRVAQHPSSLLDVLHCHAQHQSPSTHRVQKTYYLIHP